MASLWPALLRHHLEESNRQVEITLDYDGVSDLCEREGLSVETTLSEFQKLGVSTIALSEITLEKLHQEGKIVWLRGEDLPLYEKEKKLHDLFKNISLPSVVVLVSDKSIKPWLSKALASLFGGEEFRVQEFPDGFIIPGKWDDVTQISLGLDPDQAKPLAAQHFLINPRISNRDDLDETKLGYLLANVLSIPNVRTLIFSGLRNEVLGFDHDVGKVGEFLRLHQVRFGYVEAYESARALKGGDELAQKMPDSVVKVQALILPSLTRLDPEKAVETFSLGVRERNIRIIYFRPFLVNYGGKSVLETNVQFLKSLREDLERNGFELSPSRPFPLLSASRFSTVIGVTGVVVGTFLFLLTFLDISLLWFCIFFLGSLALVPVAHVMHQENLLRSIFAFWGANLFPIFGIVLFSERKPLGFFNSVLALLGATLFTVMGGFLVSSLMTDNLTMLGIQTFRGVKAILVAPVILAPWLAFVYQRGKGSARSFSDWLRKFVEPLREPVQVSHVVALLILLVGAAFMILRSGNAVPEGAVPEWEKSFRATLDTTLAARPRFKEFVIGHPFYLLASGLGLESVGGVLSLFLGGLGQADIMDSFAHLHTPLRLTLLRTVNGIWLGIILGAFLRLIVGRLTTVNREDRSK